MEEAIEAESEVTLSVTIESPTRGRNKLWYRLPRDVSSSIASDGAPWVVASIFQIMSEGADCIVHAQVSPSLLTNLAEFQAAWACWRPDRYKQVEITADDENEALPADPSGITIAAFTGGVDSCYTIFQHCLARPAQTRKRNIEAGLFVHGFDIPLEHKEDFQRAAQRARQTLEGVGVKLITMSTNIKTLNPAWDDTHIAGVVSAMMLLKGRYDTGLVASGRSYDYLLLPWGSNPITDHLLSSDSFTVVHDGAAVDRLDKTRAIAQWKQGFENIRVCYSAERRDENCGVCIKCAFTVLRLRILRLPDPPTFPYLTDKALSEISGLADFQVDAFKRIIQSAKTAGITDTWVEVLARRLQELGQSTAVQQQPLVGLSGFLRRMKRFANQTKIRI